MNMFEEVAKLVPKTRLTMFYVEYRPWIQDETHHYRAYLQYYPRGSKRTDRYREIRWVEAMANDPHDAIHQMEAKLMLRKDR